MIENIKPIKVICIKTNNSVKLIKGAIYELTSIYSSSYSGRRVHLKNVGTYKIDCFKLLNGESLNNIRDFNISYNYNMVDPKNKNYTGQFVRCTYSSSKSLKANEIYYVEKQESIGRTNTYNKNIYYDYKFRIRGIKNLITTSKFEEISTAEQRKIKLKNLKGEKTKTGEQTRKFLLYTEKEKTTIILELLYKVIIDINTIEINNKVELISLLLNKGKKHNIINEDIKPYIEIIKPILEPYSDLIKY